VASELSRRVAREGNMTVHCIVLVPDPLIFFFIRCI
jgi:hypothetical protein